MDVQIPDLFCTIHRYIYISTAATSTFRNLTFVIEMNTECLLCCIVYFVIRNPMHIRMCNTPISLKANYTYAIISFEEEKCVTVHPQSNSLLFH